MAMEYMHATLMLHESGREINEENITTILEANGTHVIESRVKAIVAALEGVDIDGIEPEPDPAIAATVRGDVVAPEAVLDSGVEAESEGTDLWEPNVDGDDTADVGAETEVASASGESERTDSDGDREVADDVAWESDHEDGGETVEEESASAAGDTPNDADTGAESSPSADETDEATWEFPADDGSESQSSDEADDEVNDEEDGAR